MANSGVLYMNIKAMRKHMADFIKHGKTANYEFGAYDQGYILSYFRHKLHVAELLPATFNWKPYWGNSNKTAILHFHGPKPGLLAECFAFMDNDGCDSPSMAKCVGGAEILQLIWLEFIAGSPLSVGKWGKDMSTAPRKRIPRNTKCWYPPAGTFLFYPSIHTLNS
eukprot:scaffold2514_cov158-Ochromonas_danica.AAC.3